MNLINVPSNKQKAIADDWSKIWKQMNGISLTDYKATLYIQFTPSQVWELLFTSGLFFILFF